jgi:O-antigen/teichoic acid export membrane protein
VAEIQHHQTAWAESQPLTAGSLIAANSAWSVAGDLAPMLLAFVAIPIVIHKLGVPEFGVLSVCWTVVGYMALFDLGLSRALTKLVADKLATVRGEEIPSLFWTCLLLTVGFGVLGGAVLGMAAPQLVRVLNIPQSLNAETRVVFQILALTVPLVILNSALQGFLAAYQRFDLIAAVRVPASATVFLCPLMVLPFSRSLVLIVALMLVTRVMATLAYFLLCAWVCPGLFHEPRIARRHLRPLISFGGWVTVTNFVGPLMLYGDRFLVSALLSISAVAYYVTPYEAITKLLLIPSAVARAFYPAFAEAFSRSPARAVQLLGRGANLILMIIAPAVVVAATLGPAVLGLWLGPSFAAKSASVLRWLALGVLVNATACLPFMLIQAAHRPDLVAKLNAIEFPIFLVMEIFLIGWRGIEGAAIAWSVRLTLEAAAYWIMTLWMLPESSSIAMRTAAGVAATVFLVAVGVSLPFSLVGQVLFLVVTLSAGSVAGWSYLLTRDDKGQLAQWIPILFVSRSA